jgi:S1-C subfamily serine protease
MISGRLEGGAAVAPDGTLIGLSAAGPRRRGLAIPAATVARAVEALSARGFVPRGYLGLSLHPLGRGAVTGAVVVGIEPGSPAAAAGFFVGDIVTTWNGETIRTVRDVSRRLGPDAVGGSVVIGILRAGSATDLAVTIGERPQG